MTENTPPYRFDSVDLIMYLWKKRIPLLIITTVAAIISIIVSLTIEDKFKSEVIVFPVATSSISQDLLTTKLTDKTILELGEDEEVEQLIQTLRSDDIRERIIKKYNLMEHYNIKPNQKYRYTALQKKFKKNISFTPTKFMSVRITVLDTDPQIAANIANDITSLIDTVRNNMKKDRAYKALHLVEKQYINLTSEIKKMEDSITVIRKLGVFDYESQAQVLNSAYAQAILKGNKTAEKQIQKNLDVIAKYGGAYVSMRDYIEFQKKQLSNLDAKYAEAKLDATQDLPNVFIINKAGSAERKTYPKRSIIVILSTLSTFILALLALIIFDSTTNRLEGTKKV